MSKIIKSIYWFCSLHLTGKFCIAVKSLNEAYSFKRITLNSLTVFQVIKRDVYICIPKAFCFEFSVKKERCLLSLTFCRERLMKDKSFSSTQDLLIWRLNLGENLFSNSFTLLLPDEVLAGDNFLPRGPLHKGSSHDIWLL